ncbi:hypothetical protein [Mycobacterium tuberculosis]|nr:hypothetical protein [Mycobacterium tuberculosis]
MAQLLIIGTLVVAQQSPPHPVNGAGSFIPDVPVSGGRAWYAGSTYENI